MEQASHQVSRCSLVLSVHIIRALFPYTGESGTYVRRQEAIPKGIYSLGSRSWFPRERICCHFTSYAHDVWDQKL